MAGTVEFSKVARLPAVGDNLAVATRNLEAGSRVLYRNQELVLDFSVPEGHRFSIAPIAAKEFLLSWGLPFGRALTDIFPGGYICNARVLEHLRIRRLGFELPTEPNFEDLRERYPLQEDDFRPGVQVRLEQGGPTFRGYPRGGNRGVGTRNYVVILGTSSRTASYARALETRLRGRAASRKRIDGIVAVAHTEGGGDGRPRNLEFILRTLAGFMVHPNVGAVLAVDDAMGPVNNASLRQYMQNEAYPIDAVPHRFLTLEGGFEEQLRRGEELLKACLPEVASCRRKPVSLAHLRLALQCGGSDAFSGVSANPLAGWVARELIRFGGSANLAETDELIGAEPYLLQNVRNLATAQQFLAAIDRFVERVARHGHTAEGNPSGGNLYRGLYNIALKSLGAATKRDPEVRLDYVIEYGERLQRPGYYFMDSPGNDLESLAGQVASGCNFIFFTTGNGSITNFPFVPTIKIVSTSARYQLLAEDMDVNAGAYLDGVALDELGRQLLDRTLEAASGKRTVGELAGHSQVSIWRDWRQDDDRDLVRLQQAPEPDGEPLSVRAAPQRSPLRFQAIPTDGGYVTGQIGLILPTSLCSGQIARLIVEGLNRKPTDPLDRFVALPHTEGCAVSGAEKIFARATLGHLTHPMVRLGLLLEHGCEKTHNDYMRSELERMGFSPEDFGWASVQLDGGIEKVTERVEKWFARSLQSLQRPARESVGLEALRVAFLSPHPPPPEAASSLAVCVRTLADSGATVILPQNTPLLHSPDFASTVLREPESRATLAYGQKALQGGLHVMETPTGHLVESLTGLGACGVEVMVAYVEVMARQAHPMIPLLQITADGTTAQRCKTDLDLVLEGEAGGWAQQILGRVLEVASGLYQPQMWRQGNTDFQVTRGLLGVSM